ncbi:MAG: bifunctional UDP-sugar hydrolase/5'-nucleotidase [Bacteroidota bacterium]
MNFTLKVRHLLAFGLFLATGLSQPKTLTILHTNDIHASFVPHEAFWMRQTPKPLIGGFNELYAAVDSIRKLRATLVLDAGDVMTGNPISNIVYKGAEGGALYELMSRIGYDAACPGNHDFDISRANFQRLTAVARYPIISANLVDQEGKFSLNMAAYTVLEKDGLKIGLIGVMSDEFYSLVSKKSSAGLKVLSPVETVQKLIDQLDPQTDLLIAISHEGVQEDSILAARTKGLDIIISGHSHTRINKPKIVNGVIIVQTGSNCENLGVLDVTVEKDQVTSSNGMLLPLWYNGARPASPLSGLIDSMKQQIDKDYQEVIGTLKEDWKRRNGETAIGNFIADAQREAAGADVGFMNNSGIRKDLAAGPVTRRDVFEVLPFANTLVTFPLTGAQVRTMVLHEIQTGPAIQTSGIKCEWRKNPKGDVEILRLEVNGAPVEDAKTYQGAASDYMVGEAKRYLGFDVTDVTQLDQSVFSSIEQKVRKEKVLTTTIEGRIKEVQKP